MNREDLNRRLLSTFVEEVREQVAAMNKVLLDLEQDPKDPEMIGTVLRIAHTLKGAARAVDVKAVEEVCHAAEEMLAGARDGSIALDDEHLSLLFEVADGLSEAAEKLADGATLDDTRVVGLARHLKGEPADEPILLPEDPASSAAPSAGPAPGTVENIRVRISRLDELSNTVSDLRLASDLAFSELHLRADPSAGETARVGSGYREPAIRYRQDALRRISDLTRSIGDQVLALRMAPFREACETLPRVVRDLAQTTGKKVTLVLEGQEVEADRAVLDGLRDILVQLVRNAVDHGIEPSEERTARGKPAEGRVGVSAELSGGMLRVVVSDDGRGLDVDAIRRARGGRGLVPSLDGPDISQILFEPGFTTRVKAGELSGRGVGLDIVRDFTDRFHGGIDVKWEEGQGSRFILECPSTIASLRVLLVSLGEHPFALPIMNIDRVVRMGRNDLRRLEDRDHLLLDGEPIPLVSLGALLGPPLPAEPLGDSAHVVVLRSNEVRLAVIVDQVVRDLEAVIHPFDEGQLASRHAGGICPLPGGRAALLLNPHSLVSIGRGAGPDVRLQLKESEPERPPVILVVDDSITTRTLEDGILRSAGYETSLAVDGEEAWQLLKEVSVDLVVADVEMPRMDGFELCERIRGAGRLKEMPVILVTSKEDPGHRERGMKAGANAYIGKSGFDNTQLLETIRRFLG